MLKRNMKIVSMLLLVFFLFLSNSYATELSYDNGNFTSGWGGAPGVVGFFVNFALPTTNDTYKLDSVKIYIFNVGDNYYFADFLVLDNSKNVIKTINGMSFPYTNPGWYNFDLSSDNILISNDFYMGAYWHDINIKHMYGILLGSEDNPPITRHSYMGNLINNVWQLGDASTYSDYGIRVDVSLNTVPEPPIMLLLGSGLLGLIGLRRKFRK